jgi:hypothetical protein
MQWPSSTGEIWALVVGALQDVRRFNISPSFVGGLNANHPWSGMTLRISSQPCRAAAQNPAPIRTH